MSQWISVDERLPEEKQYVLIWLWSGGAQVARIEKGISWAERRKMRNGEMDDPLVKFLYGDHTVHRSNAYYKCDEHANNKKPYCWIANGGPMEWFGQEVSHWMPLPERPERGKYVRYIP